MGRLRGESMGNAKLTLQIVREIKRLRRHGFGWMQIHRLLTEKGLQVSVSGVRNVVRERTWAWVQ